MNNSFVAFFDVLGFKSIVENNSHETLMDIYNFGLYDSIKTAEEASNIILGLITPKEELDSLKIKTFVISDSMIFIQDTMTQRGLLYIISFCRMLIGSAMADGIPIRGALSFGPVSIENKRGTTIVGLGLTKAYNLESKQQWSGGIIDKECFDVVPKENTNLLNDLIFNKTNPIITKYDVPLKNGTVKEELVMDWTIYGLIKSEKDIVSAFGKHNKKITEDVKIKIDNTVLFYSKMKSLI